MAKETAKETYMCAINQLKQVGQETLVRSDMFHELCSTACVVLQLSCVAFVEEALTQTFMY